MLTADFVRLYPRLSHLAADGAWPSIAEHGLLPTAALLEKWNVDPAERERLVRSRRPDAFTVADDGVTRVWVRDQKPIDEASLASVLDDGLVPSDWYEMLNTRVFFFPQRAQVLNLLSARSYRGAPHTVITVDTATLVDRYEDRIEFCRINSGFARPHSKARRGLGTFVPIAAFEHPARQQPRQRTPWDVTEVTVRDGVPDLREMVVSVERMQDGQLL